VFLTAFSSKSFKQQIISLGLEQVYEKPLQIDTLREIFDNLDLGAEEDAEVFN
jgi:hypothetical protein